MGFRGGISNEKFKTGANLPATYTGPNGELLVNPSNGLFGASDTYGRISRQQWEDYKARFGPVEQELMDYVNSPAALNAGVTQATTATAGAYDRGQQSAMRSMQGIGATMSGDQQAAMDRKFKFSKNLAVTDASNIARMQGKERRMMALVGGSNSFSSIRGEPEQV